MTESIRYWRDEPGREGYEDVTDELITLVRDLRDDALNRMRLPNMQPIFAANRFLNATEGKTCQCDGGGSMAHVPGSGCTSGPGRVLTDVKFHSVSLNLHQTPGAPPLFPSGKDQGDPVDEEQNLPEREEPSDLRSPGHRAGAFARPPLQPWQMPTPEAIAEMKANGTWKPHHQCINCAHCDEQHDAVADADVDTQFAQHGAWYCSDYCEAQGRQANEIGEGIHVEKPLAERLADAGHKDIPAELEKRGYYDVASLLPTCSERRAGAPAPNGVRCDDTCGECRVDPITATSKAAGPNEWSRPNMTPEEWRKLHLGEFLPEDMPPRSNMGGGAYRNLRGCAWCGEKIEDLNGLCPECAKGKPWKGQSDRPVTYDDERPDGNGPSH